MNGRRTNALLGTDGRGTLADLAGHAARGAHILALSIDDEARREEACAALRQACRGEGQRVEAAPLDVSDPAAVDALLGAAIARDGAPYVLLNSAGLGGALRFEETSYERFDRTMRVNVYGVRNTCAACVPAMKAAGQGGHIVNVSSLSGLVGIFGYTAYGTSKFAVVGFSKALRADGMRRRQAIIIPGRRGRLLVLLERIFPALRERLADGVVRRIQRERAGI
jgi:NAD(P)-dependent dehydrogenase (short-subunit alcohol dehydrogenase family)